VTQKYGPSNVLQRSKYGQACFTLNNFQACIYGAPRRSDLWNRLHKVNSRIICVAGGKSTTYLPDKDAPLNIERLGKQFVNAVSVKTLVIENVGHFLPLENSQKIAELIAEVLKEIQNIGQKYSQILGNQKLSFIENMSQLNSLFNLFISLL
jgi:pimeloyl-ACP methyl ester carboxylesterase